MRVGQRARLVLAAGLGVVVTLACAACVGRQGRDDVELVGRIEPVPAPPAHKAKKVRETPPPSGPARDLSFPPITRKSLDNGLEINVVPWRQLPVVYLQLVVRSGSVRDPARLPGVAGLVAAMLKEGSKRYSSAQIAETIEFLGASLDTSSKQETLTVHLRTLRPHLEEAFAVLADVVQSPRFSAAELKKLKKRELDRLQLQEKNPNFIASRTFYRLLYGAHPYARIDTTPAAVRAIQRKDLQRWHKQYVRPNNAFLVAVGDVDAATIEALCAKHWRRWKAGKIKALRYPTPSAMQEGRVVVVDRPDSVQSVIRIGNLAIARKDPDYVPLVVANQVLGGSAASRLFMDLRERQSLTYGAYSRVGEAVDRGTFQAFASVRNEVTSRAMSAFVHHLRRIATAPVPEEELANAQSYLSNSFPLQIDTPGKIASLLADLRIYGLPDDYWDSYRTQIRSVQAQGALRAAKAHIRPEQALVVVVGKAAAVADGLRAWGEVEVVDAQGKVLRTLAAREAPKPGTAAP